jgi:hypothetical protein
MPFQLSNIFQFPDISNIFTFESTESNDSTLNIVKCINESSEQEIIGYINNIRDTGCYIVMINSDKDNGPNGIFCLSRSDKQKEGEINTLVSSEGICRNKIILKWNSFEKPSIILKRNKNKISSINNLYGSKSKDSKIVLTIKIIKNL